MTRRILPKFAAVVLLFMARVVPVHAVAPDKTLSIELSRYLEETDTGNVHTRKAKRHDIQAFEKFLAFKSIGAVDALSASLLNSYVTYRVALGDSPATANRRLSTASHFVRIARTRAGLSPLLHGVRPLTIKRARPKWFDEQAGERIRSAVSLDRRDSLIVELMYSAGLRRAEVCDVTIGQYDSENQLLKDVKRKHRKYQDIFLADSVVDALTNYLPERERYLRDLDPLYAKLPLDVVSQYPLIPSRHSAKPGVPGSWKLSPESVRYVVNGIREKTGLSELTAHKFRHSFVRDVYKSTNDILLTKEAAGHASVDHTFKYAGPDENAVAAAVRGLRRSQRR
jgi:site-specific recombinase XerD